MHVALHLLFLPLPQFVLVVELHCQRREVVLEVVRVIFGLHREPSFLAVSLLLSQHLLELLFTSLEQQLPEVHLRVVCIVEALEKVNAKFDVMLQVVRLCGGLHEDNLGELV